MMDFSPLPGEKIAWSSLIPKLAVALPESQQRCTGGVL
jgi:hypothetical protein